MPSSGKEAGLAKIVPAVVARKLRAIFDPEASGKLLLYSALVGLVSGLGAAGFYSALKYAQNFALGEYLGYHEPTAGGALIDRPPGSPPLVEPPVTLPAVWWKVLLLPTAGALLCGLLVFTLAPEAEGHGTDAMVRSFHRLKGVVRARIPVIKTIASILTIGSGGSAGREGPIAQIGAGFGSVLATRLRLTDWERRQLLLAGTAGGIGAIFQAPVGGALFAVEVLYSSTAIEFGALIPAVISSVVAYSTFCAIFGQELAFVTHESLRFHGAFELPLYLVFALVCALAGVMYVSCFYGLRDKFFHRLPLAKQLRPAVGGLMLGLLALVVPQVLAGGYGWIQQAIDGRLPYHDNWFGQALGNWIGHFTSGPSREVWTIVALMTLIALGKILATSFTISSGGSGGVFAPSLFIGAMLGGAYGLACRQLLGPEWVPQPAAYVLVGMGGFFAGVAKVPLTSLIMVSEMSGSYGLLVPLMLVCVTNLVILSSRWKLYEEQVPSLVDSPAHLGDFVIDVLARIHVRDVFQPGRPLQLVPEDMPLARVMALVAHASGSYFPVVDGQQRLVGIFSLHDVRGVRHSEGETNLIVAADIATTPVLSVTPDDDLHAALRRFTQKNIDELPVVDAADPGRILGMLRRKEVISAYDHQIASLRGEADAT